MRTRSFSLGAAPLELKNGSGVFWFNQRKHMIEVYFFLSNKKKSRVMLFISNSCSNGHQTQEGVVREVQEIPMNLSAPVIFQDLRPCKLGGSIILSHKPSQNNKWESHQWLGATKGSLKKENNEMRCSSAWWRTSTGEASTGGHRWPN